MQVGAAAFRVVRYAVGMKVTRHLWNCRWAAICVVALCVAAFMFWQCIGPVISPTILNRLPGATRNEVLRLAGEPSLITDQGDWGYERVGNPGWVDVYFDSNGIVSDINDESVLGSSVGQTPPGATGNPELKGATGTSPDTPKPAGEVDRSAFLSPWGIVVRRPTEGQGSP